MYWDTQPMLSYNRIISMIIGNRGGGKTYGAKAVALRRWHKTNEQFIYLRRFDTELDEDLRYNFLEPYTGKDAWLAKGLHIDGRKIYGGGGVLKSGKKKPKITAGYFINLSTASTKKSIDYPHVRSIIFDEFILENGGVHHYLKDEPRKLLDFYNTVDRYRDHTRLIMLSNALSEWNPYFNDWDVKVPYYGNRGTFNRGMGYIETVQDMDFIKTVQRTRLGQFIDGTKYGDYAIKNKFLQDNKDLIQKKSGESQCFLILKHRGLYVGIWYNKDHYYISKDIVPQAPIYAISQTDMTDNEQYIFALKKTVQYQSLLKAIDYNLIRYENQFCKKLFEEIHTKLRR